MANSVSELHSKLLKLTNGRVDILTDSGQYKSTYEILKDISEVWDDIVKNQGTDSAAILELIGGKRNANTVAAILENFDIAEDALKESLGSAGSAMEENQKVIESVQGHINQLKASFEELSLALIDSGLIKGVVDFAKGLLEVVTATVQFIDKVEVVKGLLIAFMVTLSITSVAQMFTASIKWIVASIKSVIHIIPAAIAAWKAYAAGTGTASAAMQASIPVIGLVLAALTALAVGIALCTDNTEEATDAAEDAKSQAEETKRKMKELADSASEYSDELTGLTTQYLEASEALDTLNGSIDTYISSRDALINHLKIEQSELDKLIEKYGSYDKALAQASLDKLKTKEVDLRAGVKAVADTVDFHHGNLVWSTDSLSSDALSQVEAAFAALEGKMPDGLELALDTYTITDGGETTYWSAEPTGFDGEYDDWVGKQLHRYEALSAAISILSETVDKDNVVYQSLLTEYMEIRDWAQEYYGAVDMLNSNLAEQYVLTEITKTGLPETKEEFDAFRQSIIDAANASGEFSGTATDVADSIDNVLRSQSNFASFYNTEDSYGNELSNFAETIEKLKSDYDLLATAQKEMASGEGISASTIQALADETDRYLDYLYEENGIVHLNIAAWKEYANEKILGDMAIIQSRLATLEVEKDALNQELAALQSKESLTAAEQEQVKELNGLLDKNTQEIASNQQAYNMYKSIFESVTTASNQMSASLKQFVGTLSKTNALETGFSKLSIVFNDVKDGGSFDWGSIVDDSFVAEFGGLGDAYDEFMRTIASSPKDINACRAAFNKLATAYIASSGALDNVTASNRDAIVAMLDQMGVTNAAAIVDGQLALNKERLKYATSEYTNLTYAEVQALYNEAVAGSVAQQALAELAVQKYLEENTTLNTESDIEQLLTLAQAANVTTASYNRLLEAKAIMTQADSAYAQYQSEYRGGDPNELASYQRYLALKNKANSILSKPLEYETIRPTDLIVDFEGVSKAAGNAKDDIESLYDSAKNGIEELIDYRKSMLEKDIENQKDAIEEQIDALQDFYDEQREMLEEQYDEEEYLAEQHEKQKAVTDLKGELAMLANDDSAWAQRRKLELKEELSEAEDELSELEKEHALDVTLDMLDDQQEAQEKQLQDQIDALDEKLNDPHALYNQALLDIRNNTLDLYQEMIEFNRRWGSGNDDDIRDMWNDAYESNEDYRDKTGSTYKDIELGDYAGYDASGVGKVSSVSSTLRKGSKGDGVKALQHALNQLGYGNSGTRSLDGSFGSGTRSAVIAFQRANGLTGDGVVGSATKAKFKALGYATGTDNATPGWHELFEGDLDEYIFTSGDGSRYRMFSGLGDKVLNAGATDFLYQFANSGGSILTQMIADLFKRSGLNNISKPVQAIEVNAGNVIVEGNADMKTVSEIRRAQRENLNFVLKSLNSLNK